MRSLAFALVAICAVLFGIFGCNDVLGITELDATDAGISEVSGDGAVGGSTPDTSAPLLPGLTGLTTSAGTLSPAFDQNVGTYFVTPSVTTLGTPSFTVTALATAGTQVTVNGVPVTSDIPSTPFPISASAPTHVDIGVTAPGAMTRHYGFDVPGMQEAYVKASNTTGGSSFGHSVAISADGNTLAVGATDEPSAAIGINGNQGDTSASGAGAVYVYVRSGITWVEQAYVKASNTRMGSNFGSSVALSANGDTLAVGATYESSGATGINGSQGDTSAQSAGAAYVFARNGTTWSQEAYVKASNTRSSAEFGYSVALTADGSTLAVGSVNESSGSNVINGNQSDTSAPGAGAVYVYVRNGSTWFQQTYFKATNARSNATFGNAVAFSADGTSLLISSDTEAGAVTGINGSQATTSAPYAGAVYYFIKNGGAWSLLAYVKASNTRGQAYFGSALAVSADGNTFAVGSFGESSGSSGVNGVQSDTSQGYAGAAYLFSRAGGAITQQVYFKASNPRAEAFFGSSIALSSDGNALAIGSYGESGASRTINGDQSDQFAEFTGAAYVFSRSVPSWSQRAYLKASDSGPDAYFGLALSMAGDASALAIGAYGESCNATGINGSQADITAPNAGAVYMFR